MLGKSPLLASLTSSIQACAITYISSIITPDYNTDEPKFCGISMGEMHGQQGDCRSADCIARAVFG